MDESGTPSERFTFGTAQESSINADGLNLEELLKLRDQLLQQNAQLKDGID